jgi:inosine-uridine nucleoside N-ribohydrolase
VHVHGANGLGDVELAGATPAPAPLAAHEAIVELVRAAPGRISLLALGPLTNLALALRAAPDVAGLVREVVVMGGAFGWQGRRGNVSPVAEANVHNDPEAADLVFGAGWPVTAVGLDVTSRCVLPAARAVELRDRGGDAGRLLHDISRQYEALYREHDGLEGCCLHDVTAAACLVDPSMFRFETGPIRVVTSGIAVGQTIQRPLATRFPPGAWDHAPPQRSCADLDAARVLDAYVGTLEDAAQRGRPPGQQAPPRPQPGSQPGR